MSSAAAQPLISRGKGPRAARGSTCEVGAPAGDGDSVAAGRRLDAAKHGIKCFGFGGSADATASGRCSVFYVPNFLSTEDEAELLAHAGSIPESLWCAAGGRRLAHFGGVPHGSGMFPEDRPAFIESVLAQLERFGCFAGIGEHACSPNHVLMNEYDPRCGGAIAPHKDGSLYEPNVAILSLQSPCLFEFLAAAAQEEGNKQVVQSILVMPRSLLVFRGVAYRQYWHGIRARRGVDVRAEDVVVSGAHRSDHGNGRWTKMFVCAEDYVPAACAEGVNRAAASTRASDATVIPQTRMTFGEFFRSPCAAAVAASSSLPLPPPTPASLHVDCSLAKRVSLTARRVRSVNMGEALETEEFRQELERRRRVFIHGVSDGARKSEN